MNALIRKEIRALLPTFIGALILSSFSFSLLLISNESPMSGMRKVYENAGKTDLWFILPFLLSPALVLMMVLHSFGHEFSAGTFSNLLSQPISRGKIWRTKTVLLAIAIVILWAAWWLSFKHHAMAVTYDHFSADSTKKLQGVFVTSVLFSLIVYSGGLWTVLLLRQVAAAFWFTVIFPAALAMVTMTIAEKTSVSVETPIFIVLSIYSIAGFLFARWLFLRAQDVQWTGGNIALPEFLQRTKGKTNSRAERTLRPRAALFFKEFQLHQSQLIMAGALALLHLAVIVVRKFGNFNNSSATGFALNWFWLLWFAMPLLVGCAAVTEERKLGTLESQLCLPVRRRTQFWIKFVSAMMLSLFLAIALPLLLEGTRILPDFHPKFLGGLSDYFMLQRGGTLAHFIFPAINNSLPVLILLGIATIIAAVSFYASTLSRNTLQSLAPAVLGILVSFIMQKVLDEAPRIFPFPLWRGWLIYLIGVPVMTLTLLALMYWNFKRVLIGWKVWRRNAAVFVASLAFVIGMTSAIYHRAWEFLTPLEPAHGIVRLEKSSAPKIQSSGSRVLIQLDDGKIWSTRIRMGGTPFSAIFSSNWKISGQASGFWSGTNWTSVATTFWGSVGVQKDGSLWVSEKPQNFELLFHTNVPPTPMLTPFGNENDWSSVTSHGLQAFLLKADGTLWRWGVPSKKQWPGLRVFEPQRLGTESDWAGIFSAEGRIAFRKKNGETWIYPPLYTRDTNSLRLDETLSVFRSDYLGDGKAGSLAWVSGRQGGFQVSVLDDGKFVISAAWETTGKNYQMGLVKKDIQLGKDTDWRAVAGEGGLIITLKADGTMWRWEFPEDSLARPESASAVRLGIHSDWVAVLSQFGSVTSLAADGGLWLWQFDSRHFSRGDEMIPPLLSTSRKPQKIGNIFDAPQTP